MKKIYTSILCATALFLALCFLFIGDRLDTLILLALAILISVWEDKDREVEVHITKHINVNLEPLIKWKPGLKKGKHGRD